MNHPIHIHLALCELLCFSEGKTRPSKRSDMDKFLSNLALLLNGNETCTAVYVHRANKEVVVARNQRIGPADELFFDRFFRLVRTYATVAFDEAYTSAKLDLYDELEATVLDFNSQKVIKRLADSKNLVITKLREMAHFDGDQRRAFFDQVCSHGTSFRARPLTTEKCYFARNEAGDDDFLQWIFVQIQRFLEARDELLLHSTNPSIKQLSLTTGFAIDLYESQLFRDMVQQLPMPDQALQHFEKISAHRRALVYILKCLSIHKDRYQDIYRNITWKVIPPVARVATFTMAPREALKEIVVEMIEANEDEHIRELLKTVAVEEYYANNETQIQRFTTQISHDVHLHAEIALSDYLLVNQIDETNKSEEIEIGISKMSCLSCSYYINELNNKYNRRFCLTDSTHEKIYSKWDYRQGEDPAVLDAVDQKLIEKIERTIMRTCLDKKRSGVKKSGDSDQMSTSLDEEEFDQEFWNRRHHLAAQMETRR